MRSGPFDAALTRGGGGALPLIVQIETAAGLLAAAEIAAASPHVSAVFFGAIDLSADLGCAVEWEALLYARSRVVLAAGAAGVAALDSPFMDVPALDALAEETSRVRRLGFTGKAAIHPTQVPLIQKAFAPSAAETAWARKIVAAYERQQGGVLLVEGQLIELPVVRSARRTLRSLRRDPASHRDRPRSGLSRRVGRHFPEAAERRSPGASAPASGSRG